MPVIRPNIRQQIQADGEFKVAGIEIDEMVGASRRNMIQQILGQITMRINQADTVTQRDVLQNEVPQQCRLSRTRLANQIKVLALVGRRNAEGPRIAPTVTVTDDDVWFVAHGSKTNRHSCHPESRCAFLAFVVITAGKRILERAGGVMATGFET